MKKLIFIAIAAIFAAPAMAQPVSDRSVIPIAVTLNRVLRLNVESGGNIEFVFNTVSQFALGINSGGAGTFYQTRFTVAASSHWDLFMGAEDATFLGTDLVGNTMPLDNVGFSLLSTGAHNVGNGEYTVGIGLDDVNALVIALPVFPFAMISSTGGAGNGGDVNDNIFDLSWRAGTMEGTMSGASILDAPVEIAPDRYVTNVLLDLRDGLL